MALQLKYADEHGILRIDMTESPDQDRQTDIRDPEFDSINQRFGQYDLFGGGSQSLFRSRYNSLEEELANTPYAFDRNLLDITIEKDLQDNRFFDHDLFGPKIDLKKDSFTVTQLIHAQDRYYDLSKKGKVRSIAEGFEVKSAPGSAKRTSGRGAFKVLPVDVSVGCPKKTHTTAASKRKGETSFAIIAEPSRPNSPRSLPVEIRPGRVSPFKGRGFREETSRHNTPKTSAANSRSNSPPRRTHSLSRIDKMAQMATLPPPGPVHRPPRDFLKENMEEIRELSELNREKNEAEAEKKKVEEEIALLKEMGLIDKKGEIKSVVNSRANSRSSSPNKFILRSRSNSPSAILLEARSSEYLNKDVGKPVSHRSRVRSISKSQPQSGNGSPKHSKIPTRQNSVSPTRSNSRQSMDKSLSKNQRHISNSTSSIHESIRIGSTVHDKRASQSTDLLNIGPTNIKSKPPISPGRIGPPPSNKSINPKRLSPIVGTPSKSPLEDSKPSSAKISVNSTATKGTKPVKASGSTPAASRLNSRQASKATSRDTSPDKRKTSTGVSKTNSITKTATKPPNTRSSQKPPVANKSEPKKPISRTNSVKNLSRAPSTKALNEKPPLSRQSSKKDITEKAKPVSKKNEMTSKVDVTEKTVMKTDESKNEIIENKDKKDDDNKVDANVGDSIEKHDNETQYDKKPADTEELVIMTKKNVVSMTTAAITSQPLEVVATVTNQLPAALEKAREKAEIERISSKDSLLAVEDEKVTKTPDETKVEKEDKRTSKTKSEKAFDESVKLRPLQPPYNNPQVERVKQKIDSILKEPEISTENILAAAKQKETPKATADKTRDSIKSLKSDIIEKKEKIKKQSEEITEFKKEASKIVDSIITPVEEPKELMEKTKDEIKKDIEPIVKVVSERKKEVKADVEKMTETLVQGGPELEVLSSNVSTPGAAGKRKVADGASDKSHSNGGVGGESALMRFPQSTSTTPKPPPRAHREAKDKSPPAQEAHAPQDGTTKTNICTRFIGKCRTACSCCTKTQLDGIEEQRDIDEEQPAKKHFLQRLNCFKKKIPEEDIEAAAGKETTIEFESETKRKRKIRDVLCGCCRCDRVADVSEPRAVDVSPTVTTSDVVQEGGCCGKRREIERRDSILSEQPTSSCCSAFNRWIVGACRRSSEGSSSRRTSLFSKNKSLSPTLPPEDTRKKLDSSLIEHTSAMRGAIPVLALPLAVFCLICNILIPGLGTIFSGLFCLCFGIPRFGVYDGAKHRIGSLVINLLVGCSQLFTVLFCLVGWGWAIWWGVIMVQVSRKYKKLKADAAAAEAEAPPVTNNNHTRP